MTEPINILHTSIAEMLKNIQTIFNEFDIDFFLIGAIARDIRLAAGKEFTAQRKTNDVDIAVLISNEDQFNSIKNALLKSGHFEECEETDIRLIYKGAIEVDLLPFGDIEFESGKVRLNKHGLLAMNMSGFKKVYPFVETLTVSAGLTLNVCTLEGLIILKLIANYDNPSRTKDITDIEHFLKVYFELNQNEIFDDYMDVMDLFDTDSYDYLELVSARIIGRKIKVMLNNEESALNNINTILTKRHVATWQQMLMGLNDE